MNTCQGRLGGVLHHASVGGGRGGLDDLLKSLPALCFYDSKGELVGEDKKYLQHKREVAH